MAEGRNEMDVWSRHQPWMRAVLAGALVVGLAGCIPPVAGNDVPCPAVVCDDAAGPAPAYVYAGGATGTPPLPNLLHQYLIDPSSGGLTELPGSPLSVPWPAGYPAITALTVDPTGKHLVGFASGTSGLVFSFVIGSDGSLSQATPASYAAGTQPLRAVFDPSGQYLYVADVSTVLAYSVNSAGVLTPLSATGLPRSAGISIHPSGRYVATGGTLDHILRLFTLNPDGSLAPLGTTLDLAPPAGVLITDVAFDPTGNYLLVSAANSTNLAQAYTVSVVPTAATPMTVIGSPFPIVDTLGRSCFGVEFVRFEATTPYVYFQCAFNGEVQMYTFTSGVLGPTPGPFKVLNTSGSPNAFGFGSVYGGKFIFDSPISGTQIVRNAFQSSTGVITGPTLLPPMSGIAPGFGINLTVH